MSETGACGFLYYYGALTFKAVLQSYKKSTSLKSIWTDYGQQTHVKGLLPFLHGCETDKLKETQNDELFNCFSFEVICFLLWSFYVSLWSLLLVFLWSVSIFLIEFRE